MNPETRTRVLILSYYINPDEVSASLERALIF